MRDFLLIDFRQMAETETTRFNFNGLEEEDDDVNYDEEDDEEEPDFVYSATFDNDEDEEDVGGNVAKTLPDEDFFREIDVFRWDSPYQGNVFSLAPFGGNGRILCANLTKVRKVGLKKVEELDYLNFEDEDKLEIVSICAVFGPPQLVALTGRNRVGDFLIKVFDDDTESLVYKERLDFAPFQIANYDAKALLVCGDDKRVHVFQEPFKCPPQQMAEFQDRVFDFAPYTVDVMKLDEEDARISAVGLETGDIFVFVVDGESVVKRLQRISPHIEGIVTCLRLFSTPSFFDVPRGFERFASKCRRVNLAASFAYNEVIIIQNATESLDDVQALSDCNDFDVVTSLAVGDFDLDGRDEVAVGTYGRIVLFYKQDEDDEWRLSGSRRFTRPVQALCCVDMTGDGVRDLVAMTTTAAHVFKIHPETAKRRRLKILTEMLQ